MLHHYDNEGKYKINADPLIFNAKEECYRELMVSYYPMTPLLEHMVPYDEADYILYMHCYARCDDFSQFVEDELRFIDRTRKKGAEIIVVGKAANAEKKLKEMENITFWGDHFTEKLGKKFGFDIREQYFVYDENEKWLAIWPVNGCLSKCKFCRRCYMDIKFESLSLEEIKENLDRIEKEHPEWLDTISLRAENLTQYGIDLYGKPMLHKLLELLESYEEIKHIELSFGMEIARITDEVLDVICRSKKIKFIETNVETGTDRLLKVIGKGHNCEKAKKVFQRIKRENPEVYLSTCLMVGLPTETVGDMVETGKFLIDIKPNGICIKEFVFSPNTPLVVYPQLSPQCVEYHISVLQNYLIKNRDSLKGTKLWGIHMYKYPISKKEALTKRAFDKMNKKRLYLGKPSKYNPYDIVL